VRGNGLAPDQLRGRGDAHWSFYTHSAGSLLEGSFYEPQGNGAYLTTAAPRRYNDFDLYLLGALRASQVGDLFTLLDIDTDKGSLAPSANDTVVSENVVDVSIAALQAAEGDRLPSASNAQQSFRMAVIVLGKAGAPPSDASIAKAARFAVEMAREFRAQTGMRIRTKLLPK